MILSNTVYRKILPREKFGELWTIPQNFPHQYSQIQQKYLTYAMTWAYLPIFSPAKIFPCTVYVVPKDCSCHGQSGGL